ncbi:MAG: hypothetical protein ABSF64_02605 [Bryobacteraceae bacterium]|jgi:hypothetical protein
MNFKTNAFSGAAMLAAAAMALMPHTLRAQDLTLDDFSTGAGKLTATSGSHTATQTGAGIVVGTRYISIVYGPGGSEFGQESILQVRPSTTKKVPSALIWSNGFDASPLIQLYWGPANYGDTPLNLNLSPPYDRFRVSFQGLSTNIVLSASVWYGANTNMYAAESCGLLASNAPFTVDIPFTTFTTTEGPIPWNAIGGLLLEFSEGSSPLNSPNLAITGFSAIPASDPAGTVTCPPPTT